MGVVEVLAVVVAILVIWVAVIHIQFLRSGRKAFDLYVRQNTAASNSKYRG
jgi:hypothetical protein